MIAKGEMMVQHSLFALYICILSLLLSVSIFIMEAWFVMPDAIAEPIHTFHSDYLLISLQEEMLKSINMDYPVVLADCHFSNMVLTEENLSLEKKEGFFGGVVLHFDGVESSLETYLMDSMIQGDFSVLDDRALWISDQMKKEYSLSYGEQLTLYDNEHNYCDRFTIKGIYKGDSEHDDYYLCQSAYEIFKSHYANIKPQLTVYPKTFRNIFPIISFVEKNQKVCEYDRQVINAIRMLYIVFLLLAIILIVTSFSIFTHLIYTYYERRITFFSIQASLGMSNKDALKVLFWIGEIQLFLIMFLACCTSKVLMFFLANYATTMFAISIDFDHFWYVASASVCIIVQMGLAWMLIRFYHKMLKGNIVMYLRETQG